VTHATLEPSAWVRRHARLIRPGAGALDLAAGYGRHARLLAAQGHDVLAVDRDAAALATLAGIAGIRTRVADLERPRARREIRDARPDPADARERFDAIVVANYLHRPSFDAVLGALADDGVLVYETFAAGNEAYGRPANPDFLLAAGELLERVRGRLAVVAFEEGVVTRAGGRAVVQRLAAVGRRYARPWPLP